MGHPIAFEEVQCAQEARAGLAKAPHYIHAPDGVQLACFAYPSASPRAALLFLHGGGAHSMAGYPILAHQLSASHRVSVFLVDLRGHGRSGGPRGHAISPVSVFRDISMVLSLIRHDLASQHLPIFLGGHSSGAAVVLNYADWPDSSKIPVDGYVFLSPEFGHRSGTARSHATGTFATPRSWVFAANEIFGERVFGHWAAVDLHYPPHVLRTDPLLLSSLSRNMAMACTPTDPQRSFALLDNPFALLVGDDDELIDPQAILNYLALCPLAIRSRSLAKSLASSHLSSILSAAPLIGNWINERCDSPSVDAASRLEGNGRE
jgi:acylglycerol lipase